MPWIIGGAMAAGTVGNVVSGVLGSKGAKAQAKQMKRAIEYQKQKDAETQARFAPYQEQGKEAINKFGEWQDDPNKDPMNYLDPGYQFRFDQGTDAIANNAATSGMLQSGDTLRALTQYGQDSASQEYGNAFDRWLNEGNFLRRGVEMGQNAAGQQGALANQGSANVGNITTNADFGAQDNVWADVAAGTGGMVGNALARRYSATPAVTPGGSNIFQMGGSSGGGSNMQANRLGVGGGYQLDPRYR